MLEDFTHHPTLKLIVSVITQLTPLVKAFTLKSLDGSELPAFTAGAHLKILVTLENGKIDWRSYSICSDPQDRSHYEIAVLLEPRSRGGSHYVHQTFQAGCTIECEGPINYFHLHADSSPALLITGGIGITPIRAMAHSLAARGRRFQLHYAGKSRQQMAYLTTLENLFPTQLHLYPSDEKIKLNIGELLESVPGNSTIFVCGPQNMIDEVKTTALLLGFPSDKVHSEIFLVEPQVNDQPLIVELARSNKLIRVNPDQSILNALRDANVKVYYDCCVGECGTCAVKILEGEAEHRDHVLSDDLKAKGFMCTCVSRAKTEKLVLDL